MPVFYNATRRTTLAERGVLGVSFWMKLRGLQLRRRFEPFDGLWLAPTSEIHMFNVFFPIDLVWLDDALRVVETTASIRPWRLKRCGGATSVIELPEGTVARTGTVAGDHIVFGADEAVALLKADGRRR